MHLWRLLRLSIFLRPPATRRLFLKSGKINFIQVWKRLLSTRRRTRGGRMNKARKSWSWGGRKWICLCIYKRRRRNWSRNLDLEKKKKKLRWAHHCLSFDLRNLGRLIDSLSRRMRRSIWIETWKRMLFLLPWGISVGEASTTMKARSSPQNISQLPSPRKKPASKPALEPPSRNQYSCRTQRSWKSSKPHQKGWPQMQGAQLPSRQSPG